MIRGSTMGLRKIRHKITKLCWRVLVGTGERVAEWNQMREFDCRVAACDWEQGEGCNHQLGGHGEVHGQVVASFVSTQPRGDIATDAWEPADKYLSASDVAKKVLRAKSGTTVSNVLVLGKEGSTPLKRMEIHFGDPEQVADTLNSLALALQESGVDFRAVRNPTMPAAEIWLTSPLHDGEKTLMSCAAMAGEQVDQRVISGNGSHRNRQLRTPVSGCSSRELGAS
jgi:hypothetical protein